MSEFIIHGFPQSTFVWTVRLAATRKGVPYSLVPEPPNAGNGHPLGKIPVVRHNGNTLYESRAIVGYLDAMFDGPPLIPTDPLAAAKAEAVVSLITTAMDQVLIRRYLFAFVFPATEDGSPDLAQADAVTEDVLRHLSILNSLCESGEVFSDPPALADLWLTPIMHYLSHLPTCDTLAVKNPALAAATKRVLKRPDVMATTPPPPPSQPS